MSKSLIGQRVAVLVANGFNEKDLIELQKALQPTGATLSIITMNHGLVNAWNGEGWGLNFAADNMLNSALSGDFSMLIIPGGSRSVEKLKLTAHTNRFITGFMDTGKPLFVMNEALELLIENGKISGMNVAGAQDMQSNAQNAGANWADAPYIIDGSLMTGPSLDENNDDYIASIIDFLSTPVDIDVAA